MAELGEFIRSSKPTTSYRMSPSVLLAAPIVRHRGASPTSRAGRGRRGAATPWQEGGVQGGNLEVISSCQEKARQPDIRGYLHGDLARRHDRRPQVRREKTHDQE